MRIFFIEAKNYLLLVSIQIYYRTQVFERYECLPWYLCLQVIKELIPVNTFNISRQVIQVHHGNTQFGYGPICLKESIPLPCAKSREVPGITHIV